MPQFQFVKPDHVLNRSNRWEPGSNELAVYFNIADLRGVLTRNLHVPAGTQAHVLAGNTVRHLNEGEHNIETFWDRLNHLFQNPHGEILITRRAALPVCFALDDVSSFDRKHLRVQARLKVSVGDVQRFRNHFMLQPGTVTTAEQLGELLAPGVRQTVHEYCRPRKLDELLGDLGATRAALCAALDGSAREHFAELGLDFHGIEALELHHQPSAADLAAQARAELATQKQQALGDAEQDQALRERELLLLGRILEAQTREDALRQGAEDEIEQLAESFRARHRARQQAARQEQWQHENEQSEWQHIREMARIQHQAQLALAHAREQAELELEHQRLDNDLQKLRIQARIEQARLMEDDNLRTQEMQAQREQMQAALARDEALRQAKAELELQACELSKQAREKAAAREHAYDDALNNQRIHDLQREEKEKNQAAELATLDKLVALSREDDQQKEERNARQAAVQQKHELDKLALLGSLPQHVLLTQVHEPEKINALLKMALAGNHMQMSPEQIQASASALPASAPPPLAGGGHAPGADAASAQAVTSAIQASLDAMAKKENSTLATAMQELNASNHASLNAIVTVASAFADAFKGHPPAPGGAAAPAAPEPNRPPMPQPPAPARPSMFVTCPNGSCRTTNLAGNQFCGACGHPLH
ncbi:hypothetical protein CK623_04350 [Vandammella animalimorsus]|uniref:Uncharacterized protein n=1 Tax=Vandammella animalimorsus TaxID=2029117 RepID=A0A2A2AS77_9BURK|nr:hypothetical protein [Vandammella animalimorsus]PAT40613.1 hypothetical protein CK623_04350 [Vandammella animalimorsus]